MQEQNEIPEDSGEEPGKGEEVPLQLPELSDVDMLSSKVQELESAVAVFKDQLLRKAAEFDNYKRRVEGESANLVRFANEDLIAKIIPVLDDLERSIKSGRGGTNDPATLVRGIELIAGKFRKILDGAGVREFESVGHPFDPEFHDALLQVPSAGAVPGTVLEEIEKGYMMHDRVIRHARVIVAAEPPAAEPGNE